MTIHIILIIIQRTIIMTMTTSVVRALPSRSGAAPSLVDVY